MADRFNCMYGEPHGGARLAVRNKVGRTVGWICIHHFRAQEKQLLNSGYHFRTVEELKARGELNGGEETAPATQKDVDTLPDEQSRFDDDGRTDGSETEAELALERTPSHRDRGQSHGRPSATGDGRSRGGHSRPSVRPETQELETQPGRETAESRGLPDGGAGTGQDTALDWPAWAEGAGYLELTELQRAILQAPFDDDDITIRYDGVIYVPWRKYWSRMCTAFHPYVPSVIPVGNPQMQGEEIVIGVVMVVNGKFIGKAWGSHRREGTNDKMSYGDRIESAISDAIAKIGKRLDMGAMLWDESFRAYWASQYAESYVKNGRTYWRRLPVAPREEEGEAHMRAIAKGE